MSLKQTGFPQLSYPTASKVKTEVGESGKRLEMWRRGEGGVIGEGGGGRK